MCYFSATKAKKSISRLIYVLLFSHEGKIYHNSDDNTVFQLINISSCNILRKYAENIVVFLRKMRRFLG